MMRFLSVNKFLVFTVVFKKNRNFTFFFKNYDFLKLVDNLKFFNSKYLIILYLTLKMFLRFDVVTHKLIEENWTNFVSK